MATSAELERSILPSSTTRRYDCVQKDTIARMAARRSAQLEVTSHSKARQAASAAQVVTSAKWRVSQGLLRAQLDTSAPLRQTTRSLPRLSLLLTGQPHSHVLQVRTDPTPMLRTRAGACRVLLGDIAQPQVRVRRRLRAQLARLVLEARQRHNLASTPMEQWSRSPTLAVSKMAPAQQVIAAPVMQRSASSSWRQFLVRLENINLTLVNQPVSPVLQPDTAQVPRRSVLLRACRPALPATSARAAPAIRHHLRWTTQVVSAQ